MAFHPPSFLHCNFTYIYPSSFSWDFLSALKNSFSWGFREMYQGSIPSAYFTGASLYRFDTSQPAPRKSTASTRCSPELKQNPKRYVSPHPGPPLPCNYSKVTATVDILTEWFWKGSYDLFPEDTMITIRNKSSIRITLFDSSILRT